MKADAEVKQKKTELQPIDKWLLTEVSDKIGYTGKLLIDYLSDYLSSHNNIQISINQFTGINGTHYQIANALNQRFKDLKYPIRTSAYPKYIEFNLPNTTKRRIKKKFHSEEKRLSEEERLRTCLLDKHPDNEYIAFLHQVIAERREEQKNINDERIRNLDNNLIDIQNAQTEADKKRAIKNRRNEINLRKEG